MRFSFRLTMLTILMLLLGITVPVIGLVSYRHSRFAAYELAGQLLEQTMERIETQIEHKLARARELNALAVRLVGSGRLRIDDPDQLVQFSLDAMEMTPDLSGFFIGLAATGESVGASRLLGKPSVWTSTYNPARAAYEVREFWPRDYPRRPFSFDPKAAGTDIRTRPWYKAALRVGHSQWTDVFVFLGVQGSKHVQGLSFVTPVPDDAGNLLAVLDADFELRDLCRFLAALKLGQSGLAYILERKDDGSQQVVAHPNPSFLQQGRAGFTEPSRDLVSPEAFGDPRVAALSAHLTATGIAVGSIESASFRFQVGGEPYLGTVRSLDGAANPAWMICAVLPEAEVLGHVNKSVKHTALIGLCVFALSILTGILVAGQVSRPLEELAARAREVEQLQISQKPVVHSFVSEVDHLGVAIEDMKLGLRSFRKYVPQGLVESFLHSRHEAVFGGDHQVVSIFMSDVANFTTIAEVYPPEQIVELLHTYLNTVCQVIESTGGIVDKYIGDGVLAFWQGGPASPNHALSACVAAIRIQAALDVLNRQWESDNKPQFHTRIGLTTGDVIVGNIGCDARFSYTIIGDAVNLAARLEGLNKVYGTRILIGDATYQQAADSIVARPLDYVAVKGRRAPLQVYELIGLAAEGPEGSRGSVGDYARGLRHYRSRDWGQAICEFEKVLRWDPGDKPSHIMIRRCLEYRESPPGADWDGVKHINQK
jgi:adenylate cyclase